jgi:hypothetical protein
LCNKILNIDNSIQTVTVIGKNGRPMEEASRLGSNRTKERHEMFFMSHALEISLGRDFDDQFGKVNYTFTSRDNLSVLSFPMEGSFLLVVYQSQVGSISLAMKIKSLIMSSQKLV